MVLEVINQKKKINNICLFYTLLYGFIQLLNNPSFQELNDPNNNNYNHLKSQYKGAEYNL